MRRGNGGLVLGNTKAQIVLMPVIELWVKVCITFVFKSRFSEADLYR